MRDKSSETLKKPWAYLDFETKCYIVFPAALRNNVRNKGMETELFIHEWGFPGGFRLAQRGKGVKEIGLSKRGAACV